MIAAASSTDIKQYNVSECNTLLGPVARISELLGALALLLLPVPRPFCSAQLWRASTAASGPAKKGMHCGSRPYPASPSACDGTTWAHQQQDGMGTIQANANQHSLNFDALGCCCPPQIYDTETTYFTSEYTNFGTVLKVGVARGGRRRREGRGEGLHGLCPGTRGRLSTAAAGQRARQPCAVRTLRPFMHRSVGPPATAMCSPTPPAPPPTPSPATTFPPSHTPDPPHTTTPHNPLWPWPRGLRGF